MLLLWLTLACSSNEAPTNSNKPRIYSKASLPAVTTPYLPEVGLLFVSGGQEQLPRRIIIDFSKRKIKWAIGTKKRQSAWSNFPTKEHQVEQGEIFILQKIWNNCLQEATVQPPEKRDTQYQEFLYLVNGEEIRVLRGYGTISQPNARVLIDMSIQKIKEIEEQQKPSSKQLQNNTSQPSTKGDP